MNQINTGMVGDDGFPGMDGFSGAPGRRGQIGDVGPRGPTGMQGESGFSGLKGQSNLIKEYCFLLTKFRLQFEKVMTVIRVTTVQSVSPVKTDSTD